MDVIIPLEKGRIPSYSTNMFSKQFLNCVPKLQP